MSDNRPWETQFERGFRDGFAWGAAVTLGLLGVIGSLALATWLVYLSGR